MHQKHRENRENFKPPHHNDKRTNNCKSKKQPTRDFDEWKLEKLWQRNQQTSEFKIVNLASHRTNLTRLN